MKNSERTYRVNGQDKTFAQLTTDEKVQILTDSFQQNAKAISFGKTPPGGWTDADRIAQ